MAASGKCCRKQQILLLLPFRMPHLWFGIFRKQTSIIIIITNVITNVIIIVIITITITITITIITFTISITTNHNNIAIKISSFVVNIPHSIT